VNGYFLIYNDVTLFFYYTPDTPTKHIGREKGCHCEGALAATEAISTYMIKDRRAAAGSL
jgi:hypothetical protein